MIIMVHKFFSTATLAGGVNFSSSSLWLKNENWPMTMMEFALQEELRPWVLATIGGVTIKKVMAVTGH